MGGLMAISDVLLRGRRGEVEMLRAKAAQMTEWFESAMVMVDNVPVGVAWSDPKNGFAITYVNAVGRAMVGSSVAGGADAIVGQKLHAIFPALAGRQGE